MNKKSGFLSFFVALSLVLSESCLVAWGMEARQNPCVLVSYPIANSTLSLSISQPPSHEDCKFIAKKLHDYNMSQVGEIVDTFITCPFLKSPIACINQNSLLLNSDALTALLSRENLSHEELQQLLLLLQKACADKGIRRLFSSCQHSSMLNEIFRDAGFTLQSSCLSFSDNNHTKTYYKDLSSEDFQVIDTPHISLTFTKQKLISESDESEIYKKNVSKAKKPFGLFISDGDQEEIKGGCIGYIRKNENALYPYAFIEILWIDDSLRGQGMGKVLLSATEDFLQKNDVKFIQLDTHDFQAPGFYERMGYELTKMYPDLFTTLSGTNSSIFMCTKALTPHTLKESSHVLSKQ